MYVSVGMYAFQFSFARIEPLFLLIKLALVSIGIEQQAFCPCGCLAHPFADFFNGEFYGCFYDDFVVDVHHDLFVFEVLHGVSEEVSSGCLDDVFDKLRPVGFNSLPPLIHSDTLIGDRCAAELVFSELGFHVRQASAGRERDKEHPMGALKTVQELMEKHAITLKTEVLVHSDQGCHYTSVAFQELLEHYHLRQSMSRRGNCWDNAPQESFFGHMKDELGERIKHWKTLEQVQCDIDDWIDYYNNDRGQRQLQYLSPNEYYNFITTGEYPTNMALINV